MSEKKPDFPLLVLHITYSDASQKDTLIEINRLPEMEPEFQRIVFKNYSGDQGVRFIELGNRPAVLESYPAELTLNPNPDPGMGATKMILLTHMGKVEITHPVISIKTDQQPA